MLAALASYCDIKHQGGLWRVRIDDIDGPRSVAGSATKILSSLDAYGFEWDGEVIWQSLRLAHYADVLAELVQQDLVFSCNCSRRSLPAGQIYPGHCVEHRVPFIETQTTYLVPDHALRCRMQGTLEFNDSVQGAHSLDLQATVGDIIIWRRDGLVSYSLACAVDDAQTSSHVVRGADLLSSTAAQVGIMQALGMQAPDYAHIPVATDANDDKLSKHSKAQGITELEPLSTLMQAWTFLGQVAFEPGSLNEFWQHAPSLWNLHSVPSVARLTV